MTTKSGYVAGVKILPQALEKGKGKEINVNRLHNQLAHCCEATTRKTAKSLGYELTGDYKVCEDCVKGKAKQKKLPKSVESKSTKPGEMMMFDISSFNSSSFGGGKHWLAITDDATDMTWSRVLKLKSELSKVMMEFYLHLLNKNGIKIKSFRCDNAGENKSFEKDCKAKGLGIKFSYTAAGTPQQNGKVERKIATIAGKLRSTLDAAGIEDSFRYGVWGEAVTTITNVEGILESATSKSPCF